MSRPTRTVSAPLGFSAAGGAFGLKASGRADLALIVADAPCRAAAVFTQHQIPSAPVIVGRRNLGGGRCRAIVCNSGQANASTGKRGVQDAQQMCRRVATHLGCPARQVLACSTGVIGDPLPMAKLLKGIDQLFPRLDRSQLTDALAARAIMTTDLAPKGIVRRVKISNRTVTLGAIAKGSGMIAPNMATMLAFITTDADLSLPLLRSALKEAVDADASLNRMSVDSDTSPSDTVALLASGQADHRPIRRRNDNYQKFTDALTRVCQDLAHQIMADGEGVTRVIRVVVRGARSHAQALTVARSVADSPLVKTAVHGGDPNWGRLTMAAGKADAQVRPEKLSIQIGNIGVYRRGQPLSADGRQLKALMKKPQVVLRFDLGLGSGRCEVLGCDLSRQYVSINADYHT